MTEARPFQPLHDRLAGKPVDTALHEGVPEWLEEPLRHWLNDVLTKELAQRVMLRLQWVRDASYFHSNKEVIVNCAPDELMIAVDAAIQLHPVWLVTAPQLLATHRINPADVVASFKALQQLLIDGRSLYRFDPAQRGLVRRVDESSQEAANQAIKATTATAADHVREAWGAAYGLTPEPDKVFNEAIRAVEEVACPLVEQKKAAANSATLGTVIGELGKNAPHKWELVLPGKDGQASGVEPIVSMMQTLWEAQLSRHGGAPKSRRQNQDEAEAAVHLAVLLVQWLSTGVLRKKP
ncbi:hypothetical protein ABZ647_17710 [Micromonospora aurantiaca]|uniref:hypothetical protein n=1 Tax=Micromonospora aurantiaca (nom. illeg.) TaxID=47850 RepID=UPI0033DD3118